MREIGGYLELDNYRLPMLHENAIALNCGRSCLAYLIRTKKIKKIWIPKFLCRSIVDICKREEVEVAYYSVNMDFRPQLMDTEEWVYLVNFYGQISNHFIGNLRKYYPNIIVDNIQAYFQEPINGIDTIYTCRKFFGVADGAFVYTDTQLEDLDVDESFERMRSLLGRYERTASEFYNEFIEEEKKFSEYKILRMSKLTFNLLHGIDYEAVKSKRTENFAYLHKSLKDKNQLELSIPDGAYMYPLYIENGVYFRKELQAKKIFIPTLWPDVFEVCTDSELEYNMAKNILPLPVDQRYGEEEMDFIVNAIKRIV